MAVTVTQYVTYNVTVAGVTIPQLQASSSTGTLIKSALVQSLAPFGIDIDVNVVTLLQLSPVTTPSCSLVRSPACLYVRVRIVYECVC